MTNKAIQKYQPLPAQPHTYDAYVARSYLNKMTNAKDRKLEFKLTLKEWQDLIATNQLCPVTKKEMIVGRVMPGFSPPPELLSIERLDPRKGYITGNVVAMSQVANNIKSSVDALLHDDRIDDESKLRLLRKAVYQLEKGIKQKK